MRNFIIGVLIGIFLGTGGTWALTKDDVKGASEKTVEMGTKVLETGKEINKVIDNDN